MGLNISFVTYLVLHLCPVIRVPRHKSVLGGFLRSPVRQTVNKAKRLSVKLSIERLIEPFIATHYGKLPELSR